MKYFVSFLLLLPFISACKKDKACPTCFTRTEECINGVCTLKEGFFSFGGRTFEESATTFLGAAAASSCIDSVLFKFTGQQQAYELVLTPQDGNQNTFRNTSLVPAELEVSENSFYLPIFFPEDDFCLQNGDPWTGTVLVETYLPDSIRMTIGFFRYAIDTITPRTYREIQVVSLYPSL